MYAKFRCANHIDIEQIVSIHIDSFKGFFLTNMGRPFLRLLYQAFINSDKGILRVAEVNGQVIGFSAGTTSPEIFFSELKRSKWHAFVAASLLGVIKHPIVTFKKLYSALFYKGDTVDALKNAALLSSIAISPNYSGNSIGAKLLSDFEEYINSLNSNELLYLTTDKYNNERVVRFYKRAGFTIDSELSQSGKRVMYRFVKTLKR